MFDDGYEVTSVRGVERVLVFDDAVGKILCWRIGTTEVSASRLGVLCRSGSFRGWSWSPKIGNPRSSVCQVIELAREQQKTLEASAGHICHSAAWEAARLEVARRRYAIIVGTDGRGKTITEMVDVTAATATARTMKAFTTLSGGLL